MQLTYSNLKLKLQTRFSQNHFFNLVDSKSENLLDLLIWCKLHFIQKIYFYRRMLPFFDY